MSLKPKDKEMQRVHRICWAIAYRTHRGQLYGDKPYFHAHLRPLHDHFARLNMWQEACLALIHDLIEDHRDKISTTRLVAIGLPTWLTRCLSNITRDPGEDYALFLRRAMSHDVSWRVKLRDVLANISHPECGRRRTLKYVEALRILTENAPDHIHT